MSASQNFAVIQPTRCPLSKPLIINHNSSKNVPPIGQADTFNSSYGSSQKAKIEADTKQTKISPSMILSQYLCLVHLPFFSLNSLNKIPRGVCFSSSDKPVRSSGKRTDTSSFLSTSSARYTSRAFRRSSTKKAAPVRAPAKAKAAASPKQSEDSICT